MICFIMSMFEECINYAEHCFLQVQGLKKDLQYIKETVQSSSILEMKVYSVV